MDNVQGFNIAFEDEVMGWYYELGVLKFMRFKELFTLMINNKPLPKTFAKRYALEPLIQVLTFYSLPGHIRID
jgi:hypothetical protein